jgi:hypothetical protein
VIDPQATFTLTAEVAIGLAGFAGVATAFGGRDRAYEKIEIARLRSLFSHAFLALAISLLVISLRSFGLDETDSYFWSSSLGALIQAPLTCYFSVFVWRFAIEPTASTSWGGVAITICSTSACFLLLSAIAIQGGSLGLLVSGLSTQLLFGLWVFTRLLIHRY